MSTVGIINDDTFAIEPDADPGRPVHSNAPRAFDIAGPDDDASRVDRYALFQQRRRGVIVGRFGIMLPAGAIYEIIESANISPMPGVTGLFRGFVNHRGNVAPVYDLAELTDETDIAWERKRLLILNAGAEAVAIKLYELPVPVSNEYSVPNAFPNEVPDMFQRHVKQAYRTADRLWLDLDLDAFFETLSRLCLKADRHDSHSPE